MNGSDQFPTYYCNLRDHIREAQKAGGLFDPMPAKMYVDWALGQNLPMPPTLAAEVTEFFDSVKRMGTLAILLSKIKHRPKTVIMNWTLGIQEPSKIIGASFTRCSPDITDF